MTNTETARLTELETRIRTETNAARAAIKVALGHASNAGSAYTAIRDLLSQSQTQAWLARTTCADRHTIMCAKKISLNAMARTLADLMLDTAAAHISQNTRARSRSEQIEINRAKHERAGA
jgi:hypothetical protein